MSYVLLALCCGAALANGEDTCVTDVPVAQGAALLQKKDSIQPGPHLSLGASLQFLHKEGYATAGYLGAPSCVPVEKEAAHRQASHQRLSVLAIEQKTREPVGSVAPLDAIGFKQTSELCCPSEMEMFFGRLLESQGLEVCSKPHVQGLMHWFTCVPDMDFQYVLDVIANGNPCKYWAPKGETCPTLSPQCEGHHCGAPIPLPTLGSISSFIFLDAKSDGDQAGDSGLAGVTVSLIQDGKVIATTVTGSDGGYNFDKLPAGEYTVKVTTVPEGFDETFEEDDVRDGTVTVTIGAGEDKTAESDFGFGPKAPGGSIGDFIFLDANGDGNQTGDKGLEGVTVALIQGGKVIATAVTGPDGHYNFDKLPAGAYTVKVVTVPDGFDKTFEPDDVLDGNVTVTIGVGEENKDVDFGFGPKTPQGSIGDFIFLDANGDGDQTGDKGLEGVTVSLMQDGEVIATAVTGPDGHYNFDKLPAGEYTVKVTSYPEDLDVSFEKDGVRDGSVTVTIGAGEDNTAVDFGFTKTTTTSTTTIAITTTTTTTTENCYDDVELVFWNSTRSHSNLGGAGPDGGDTEFRISGLGTHEGQDFDMIITSDNYADGALHQVHNNIYGYFGVIFVKKEKSVNLKFTIVKSGTSEPFVLPKFYFSFFDLDAGALQKPAVVTEATNTSDATRTCDYGPWATSALPNDDGTCPYQEELIVVHGGFVDYYVDPNTEFSPKVSPTGGTQFKATVKGDRVDNPTDPLALTALQQKRTVTFLFKNTATLEATYSLMAGGPFPGRDVYFAGKSTLVTNTCENPGGGGLQPAEAKKLEAEHPLHSNITQPPPGEDEDQ